MRYKEPSHRPPRRQPTPRLWPANRNPGTPPIECHRDSGVVVVHLAVLRLSKGTSKGPPVNTMSTAERATARTEPPFRADHVGSFLRPKFLLDAREQFRTRTIDAAQLRNVEDEAIRGVVEFQEDLGLRGITDGEYRRTYFHIDFLTQ